MSFSMRSVLLCLFIDAGYEVHHLKILSVMILPCNRLGATLSALLAEGGYRLLIENRENKKDPTKAPEGDLDEVRAASHLALSAGAKRDRFLSVCRHTRTSQGDGSLKVVASS